MPAAGLPITEKNTLSPFFERWGSSIQADYIVKRMCFFDSLLQVTAIKLSRRLKNNLA